MKKTLFKESVAGGCYLYVDIEPVYGGFILETGGDPITLNDLEEGVADGITECEKLIETINNIVANPNTYWEPCDDDDEEYVSDYINAWGIDHD